MTEVTTTENATTEEDTTQAQQYVAKNKIVHGRGADEDPLVFEPGDVVSGLDQEDMDNLLASDSIGYLDKATSEALDENDRLKQQVADLTEQLNVLMANRTAQEQSTDGFNKPPAL